MKAVGALVLEGMGTHLVKQAQMRAFTDVVVVHRSEDRTEAVGVGDRPFAGAVAGTVADRLRLLQGDYAFEEAIMVTALKRAYVLAGQGLGYDLFCGRNEAAGNTLLAGLMHPED